MTWPLQQSHTESRPQALRPVLSTCSSGRLTLGTPRQSRASPSPEGGGESPGSANKAPGHEHRPSAQSSAAGGYFPDFWVAQDTEHPMSRARAQSVARVHTAEVTHPSQEPSALCFRRQKSRPSLRVSLECRTTKSTSRQYSDLPIMSPPVLRLQRMCVVPLRKTWERDQLCGCCRMQQRALWLPGRREAGAGWQARTRAAARRTVPSPTLVGHRLQ